MAKVYKQDDLSVREDLLGVMTNISPSENKLWAEFEPVDAHDIFHQWPVDTLKTPGTNANVQGADPGYTARTNPTRKSNFTQIVEIAADVTDTEKAVVNAGFEDRFSYELDKGMQEFKNDYEFALMRGTLVTGAGTVATQMAGLKAVITTNATSQSGITFIEQTLNDLLELAYNAGGNPNQAYVGTKGKRRISSFTANSTRQTQNTDEALVNTISIYESDFSEIESLLHRYAFQSGDQGGVGDVAVIESGRYFNAWLRKPNFVPLAKTGDSTKGMIVGEGTLEARAENSSAISKQMN